LNIHPGFVHVLQAQLVKIDQATHDVLGTLARAAHVKTHEILEAHIDLVFGQNFSVNLQHFWGREGLLGGNASVGAGGQVKLGH
jgi:hypothetical protein